MIQHYIQIPVNLFTRRAPAWCGAVLAIAVGEIGLDVSAQVLSDKRGFAHVDATYDSLQSTGASWYYTWGRHDGTPDGFDATHAPMFWSRWGVSQANINTIRNNADVEWVLGFNEPERPEQANMSVAEAVGLWRTLAIGFRGSGKKLVSPAVSHNADGRAWISDFKTQLDAQGLNVDASAFHWYGASTPNNPAGAAANFINSVNWHHDLWGKPVFVTEFAMHDWEGNYTDAEMLEANRQFLDIVLPWMDSTPWVEGYAWYNWFSDSRLYDQTTGRPTPMGYEYVGVIHDGDTYDFGGEDHGEHVAYLANGQLVNDTGGGLLRYIDAIDGGNSLGGSADWQINEANSWVKVAPGATLRKVDDNTVTLSGTTLENQGTFEVVRGKVRIESGLTMTGGPLRVKSLGNVTYGEQAGITAATIGYDIELIGGTLTADPTLTEGLHVSGGASLVGRGRVESSLTALNGAVIRPESTQGEQILDNFSRGLTAYTDTRILDANGGGSNTYTWQNTAGGVEIATTGYDGFEQAVLTRNDVGLGVGEELRADYSHSALDTQDIGLYVGAGTPSADVREDFLNIYVRRDGFIYSRGFDGHTSLPLTSGGAVVPDELFVARIDSDTFELGYYLDGLRHVVTTREVGNSGIGDTIGFFAEVRGTGVRGMLDNLTLVGSDGGALTAGLLSIAGDFTLAAGATLEIDIFGAGQSDHLLIDGAFTAFGDLYVTHTGLALAEGDSFDLFSFASAQGSFGSLNLPSLHGDLYWDVSGLLTDGILAVASAAALPGDYNGDGFVSQADLDLVLLNWGDGVLPLGFTADAIPGGGTFDGLVSQNELDGVLLNWGSGTPLNVGAIPEPASAGLLVVLGAALGVCRRRAA